VSETAASRPERTALRIYNGAQRLMTALGRGKPRFVDLDERMHDNARKTVGFDDFGDPAYRKALGMLLEAYDREARLTPFGRMVLEQQLSTLLCNRLRAQKMLAADPGIVRHEIRRPIFILGLPRTGTTALHHLLGQDPGIQVLEYWLGASPQPRPPRDGWERLPDFKRAVRDLKMTYWLDPSLKAIHLMTADGPEECRHLLSQSFTDDTFDCNATIPSYSQWYASCDMRPTYAHHRRLLQIIGSTSPERRWVLKYPVHMRNLGTVLETYPDACFVHCHRDPAKVLPSLCSLVVGWRAISEERFDREALAREQMEVWAAGMEHAIEVRRSHDPARFFDLSFAEVVADPIGAVKRIYARFEVPLMEESERRLRAWRDDNPRGKYGEHRYAAADFGLTTAMIHDRYAAYIDHFGIVREPDDDHDRAKSA
jgi:Sulfotransferase family